MQEWQGGGLGSAGRLAACDSGGGFRWVGRRWCGLRSDEGLRILLLLHSDMSRRGGC